MILLVIFDMDGLMFDTENVTCRAFIEKGKEYDLELVYENLQGKEQFVLKKTYVENNILKTYDYIIFNTNLINYSTFNCLSRYQTE